MGHSQSISRQTNTNQLSFLSGVGLLPNVHINQITLEIRIRIEIFYLPFKNPVSISCQNGDSFTDPCPVLFSKLGKGLIQLNWVALIFPTWCIVHDIVVRIFLDHFYSRRVILSFLIGPTNNGFGYQKLVVSNFETCWQCNLKLC